MLWLALRFPLLPLEALPSRRSPSVVVARGRVLCADRAALLGGVAVGQKLSSALGLLPGLAVFERDAPGERQALESLACWAGRFTPTVGMALPDTLLLEIGGCLRLFGGAEALVGAVAAGCAAQSYTCSPALAPTPLGAHWLARAGGGAMHAEAAAMQAALARLPCTVPDWPAAAVARLEAFGLRRLGDLRAMPSAGLRRRLGSALVDDLARAWGEMPDPQTPFVFPEHFDRKIELPTRVEHAEALAFAGQRLFAALAGWLHERQLLARHCRLRLGHDDGSESVLGLGLAEPAADEGRFGRLLREHLARLHLRAPVEALSLSADEVVARPGASAGLFAQPMAGEGVAACLERLQARLGEAAVWVLGESADYRPEGASLRLLPSFTTSTVGLAAPAVPAPQRLAEQAGSPQWHGPLQLLSRAERLESGWWDEGEMSAGGDGRPALGDVRRDYFVASNPQGQSTWIFRDAQGWFLHGLFA